MLKRLSIIITVLIVFITGCVVEDPINTAPLPLVGPDTISTDGADYIQYFQLYCDTNPDGSFLYDEDGDTVTVVQDGTLPSNIVLNTSTGVITITRSALFTGNANFWTEDGNGGSTESEKLTVNFNVTSTNAPPYPINGPVSPQEFAQSPGLSTFQLTIDQVGGQDDPNIGDTVYYRSSDLTAYPWITLDENTGIVTVDTTDVQSGVTIDFWTEDNHGLISEEPHYSITISVIFT